MDCSCNITATSLAFFFFFTPGECKYYYSVCFYALERTNVHACYDSKETEKVQSTVTNSSRCENKSAVTSAKCSFSLPATLALRLWWSSCLVLHLLGLYNCTTLWVFLLYFASLFVPPDLFSLCLKAGAPRQAIHHVWMCSDTSSSQGLISQGKMGIWHVYILFPFLCCIKNPPPSYLPFPTALQTRRSLREKQNADPSLTPKEEGEDSGADKQESPWETTETLIHPPECKATACVFRSMNECLLERFLFLAMQACS